MIVRGLVHASACVLTNENMCGVALIAIRFRTDLDNIAARARDLLPNMVNTINVANTYMYVYMYMYVYCRRCIIHVHVHVHVHVLAIIYIVCTCT